MQQQLTLGQIKEINRILKAIQPETDNSYRLDDTSGGSMGGESDNRGLYQGTIQDEPLSQGLRMHWTPTPTNPHKTLFAVEHYPNGGHRWWPIMAIAWWIHDPRKLNNGQNP